MTLSLKNIGKVKDATVKIVGITVIAGENNTGKSTIGKVLYSTFNGFHVVEQQLKEEKSHALIRAIERILAEKKLRIPRYIISDISEQVADRIDLSETMDTEDILLFVIDVINSYSDRFDIKIDGNIFSEKDIRQLSGILKVPNKEITKKMLNDRFIDEFHGQPNNIHSNEPGKITLTIKGLISTIEIDNNTVNEFTNNTDLQTEAVYVDDPFIIDDNSMMHRSLGFYMRRKYFDHRSHLKTKLATENHNTVIIDQIFIEEKFNSIFDKIGVIFEKDLFKSRRPSIKLNDKDAEKPLDIRNLSAGMKTFLIIKTLLNNGTIEENGTIILDEPEIHLHPAWQLLFAELIVLLQKEFSLHILITTHSPYFLRAIQVYAGKHKIANMCKYYLSELDGEMANIVDVTHDIDQVYKKMFQPFQELEDSRWNDD